MLDIRRCRIGHLNYVRLVAENQLTHALGGLAGWIFGNDVGGEVFDGQGCQTESGLFDEFLDSINDAILCRARCTMHRKVMTAEQAVVTNFWRPESKIFQACFIAMVGVDEDPVEVFVREFLYCIR